MFAHSKPKRTYVIIIHYDLIKRFRNVDFYGLKKHLKYSNGLIVNCYLSSIQLSVSIV